MMGRHRAFHERSYLNQRIRETDEDRHALETQIYQLNAVSLQKGIKQDDYSVRDKLSGINAEFNRYYEYLRLFELGRNGDVRAIEDILYHFEINYLDRSRIGEMLKDLLLETGPKESRSAVVPGDASPGQITPARDQTYYSNIFRNINNLEQTLAEKFFPLLRKFLKGINEILFCSRLISLMDRAIPDRSQGRNGEFRHDMKRLMEVFFGFHYKITGQYHTREEALGWINNLLGKLEYEDRVLEKTGVGSEFFEGMIGQILPETRILADLKTEPGESQPAERFMSRRGADLAEQNTVRVRIADLLEDLSSLGLKLPEGGLTAGSGGGPSIARGDRILFHAPGSFDITLKAIADYLSDSLIFIFAWLGRELRKGPLINSLLEPMVQNLSRAEYFVKKYREGLGLSTLPEYQKEGFFTGDIQQYIPRSLGRELTDSIRENCEGLEQAFGDTFHRLDLLAPDEKVRMSKALAIVRESLHSACQKITVRLRELKI